MRVNGSAKAVPSLHLFAALVEPPAACAALPEIKNKKGGGRAKKASEKPVDRQCKGSRKVVERQHEVALGWGGWVIGRRGTHIFAISADRKL